MAAAMAAINNKRRKAYGGLRDTAASQEFGKSRAQAAAKNRVFWAEVEKQKTMKAYIRKYDKAGNGKLNQAELAAMLQVSA